MPRACPEPGRRGGRRPGAGAPKGNLNGLKTGRHSPRFLAFAAALAADPGLNALFRIKRLGPKGHARARAAWLRRAAHELAENPIKVKRAK
jgi:hypothetical protein